MYSRRLNSSSPALKTSSLGIGMPTTRWMIGPVSLVILRPIGSTFSIHHLRRLGQGEEAKRLAGRRRVDDDHVVQAGVVVVGDPEQRPDLVHAGQDRHLLGHDLVEASPAQDRCGVLLDPSPVARDVVEDVRLLRPQVRRDLERHGAELAVERVAEAVGDVGRHHDRAVAAVGAGERGGGGDARLADAALSGVDEDAGHAAPARGPRF